MVGMRDIMAHEYASIDLIILWKTINEDVPSLKPLIQDIIGNTIEGEKKINDGNSKNI
jgi:uncharacterized protein with HEPN domain